MKKLFALFLFSSALFLSSCSKEDCRECTGTLNNGNPGDITVCNNEDGTITRTNNLDGTVVTDSTDFAGGVAFVESLGLDCQ